MNIIGIGTALPEHWVSQNSSYLHAKKYCVTGDKQDRLLAQLYRRTNILQRFSVLLHKPEEKTVNFFPSPTNPLDKGPLTSKRMQEYNVAAAELSHKACILALSDAQLLPGEITHLITASCTGFTAPGFDLKLINSLALSRNIYRTHIGFMGCHAAINALRVAQGFYAANSKAQILLCATEICSIHFQYGWDSNNIVANSLFADGSAALVLGQGSKKELQYDESKSYVIPNSEEAITWNISDNGFVMSLSPSVPKLIKEHLPNFLHTWLNELGIDIKSIDSWAVHPGGSRILDAVQSCLSLSSDSLKESRQILAECGNMSSPTVLFILQHLLTQEKFRYCLMLSFGPGLTIEAALLSSARPPVYYRQFY